MKRKIKSTITTLLTGLIIGSLLTGCDISIGQQTANLDDGSIDPNSVPGYSSEDNIDAQVNAAIQAREQENPKADVFKDISDKELEEFKNNILSFHDVSNNTTRDIVEAVTRYEDLRNNMNLYAYNVIKRPNCEQLIKEMQDALVRSRFKRHDNDNDGISDYYEMMVSGTSPLLNKSIDDKLDSHNRYNVAYIMYIDQSGNKNIIQPEFSKMFYDAIVNGNIKPLDNQYIVLNLRAYGRELDGFRLQIDDETNETISEIMSKREFGSTYPISFKITGTNFVSTQLQGDLDIEHKDYTGATKYESVLIQTGVDVIVDCNYIDYLARTPSSTSLPPDDSIAVNKTYTLVFPYVKDFEQSYDATRLEIDKQLRPEMYEKDNR